MSFGVHIVSGMAQVEPGATATVSVEIENRSAAAVSFELEIEGLDAEWTAIPVPSILVQPGEKRTELIFIKPPRASESLAGTYPFVVKVRSLEDGEQRTEQGILEVKPFHYLSLDLNPRKVVVSPFAKEATVQVTVMNLGNSEHTIQLFSNDPDDLFAFEFESEQVTLGPGQQRDIAMHVSGTKNSLFANPRLQTFTLTGRSVDMPSVAASTQGQIEQKALLTPGILIVGIFVMALAAGWWFARPKPPMIDSLTASPNQVVLGEEIIIQWTASNAKYVDILVGSESYPKQSTSGQITVPASELGQLNIEATAIRDGEKSRKDATFVNISEPVVAPASKVVKFSSDRKSVRLGESFLLSYELSADTVRAVLGPTQEELVLTSKTKQVKADVVGPVEYTITPYNKDGKPGTVARVKITVTDASLAEITQLAVSPKEVDPAISTRVTVSWKLTNARRAELKIGSNPPIVVDHVASSYDFDVTEDTDVTLTAYDENGKTVTQTTKIKVKLPDPPETTGGSTAGAETGGGGTTGITTVPPQ